MINSKNKLIPIIIILIIFFGIIGFAKADSDDFDGFWEDKYEEEYVDSDNNYGNEEESYGYQDSDYEWKEREYDDESLKYRSYKNESFQDSDNDSIYDQYDVYHGKDDLTFAIDSDSDGIIDGEDKHPGEDDFAFLVTDLNQNGIADDLENLAKGLLR